MLSAAGSERYLQRLANLLLDRAAAVGQPSRLLTDGGPILARDQAGSFACCDNLVIIGMLADIEGVMTSWQVDRRRRFPTTDSLTFTAPLAGLPAS